LKPCLGLTLVRWELNPAVKYLVIVLISLGLIMALYDLLIKRINILRFLFGMRTIPKIS
jgi:glucans biosynthesis protein C